MDFRKKFRVKPGRKFKLADIDPGFHGHHESEADAKQELEQHQRQADGHAAPVLRRPQPRAADRAARHRRGRQGRHLLARDQRHGPAGRQGAGLQAADARRARARLPVAGPSARSRQGRGRGLQPLALRGRAGRARAQARPEAGLAGALRLHQSVGGASQHREQHHDPEVLPLHLEGRAARPVQGAARRSRPAVEDQRRRTTASATIGTTTSTPSRMR